jgi:hypothetical protein
VTRYRFVNGFLPDVEVELIQIGSFKLPDDMVWCNLAGEARIATYAAILEPVEPPSPPEPTEVGIAYQVGGEVYQRGDPEPYSKLPWGGRWDWQDWPTLCQRAMGLTGSWPVRLVPDPAVGVELPWRVPANEINVGAESIVDVNDDGEIVERVRLVMGGYHQTLLTPAGARAKSAALAAAADAAEKEAP